MRNTIAFLHVSLDGFVAGPDGELDWVVGDDEVMAHVTNTFESVDTAMYGRTTYQMMEGFWPTVPTNPDSSPHELEHAKWVEDVQKIVVSKTLDSVSWNNTTLIKANVAEELNKLKQQSGKDMMIFGSPGLVHSLLPLGLIDKYYLYLNPILLGRGTPLFVEIDSKFNLNLLNTKSFSNGVVALQYEAKRD